MSDQPEALRLADYLSAEEWPGGLDGRKLDKAATELRRLHKAEADFHMDYRMKCDAELKKLQAERDALLAAAEKGSEYVLAHINQDLKAERDAAVKALKWLDRWLGHKPMPECTAKIKAAIDAARGAA